MIEQSRFDLTEEQRLLEQTVQRFAATRAPIDRVRQIRDAKEGIRFYRQLWREMADQGFCGVIFDENFGGLGLGYTELGIIAEGLGRQLAVSPLMSTVLLSGSSIVLGGSEDQKEILLPVICDGSMCIAFGYQETPRFSPYQVRTLARRTSNGFVLQGHKAWVIDGGIADKLIVVARTSSSPGDHNGLTLFIVDAAAPGISMKDGLLIDSRNAASIQLDEVQVPLSDIIGDIDGACSILQAVFTRASIMLAAELIGSAIAAFGKTIDYLKTRKQFGKTLGSFQALQHQAAKLFCDIEMTRALVHKALAQLDARTLSQTMRFTALAKAQEVSSHAAAQGLQVFGGMGMTDEFDIGLHLKHARVGEILLGDPAWQRASYLAQWKADHAAKKTAPGHT